MILTLIWLNYYSSDIIINVSQSVATSRLPQSYYILNTLCLPIYLSMSVSACPTPHVRPAPRSFKHNFLPHTAFADANSLRTPIVHPIRRPLATGPIRPTSSTAITTSCTRLFFAGRPQRLSSRSLSIYLSLFPIAFPFHSQCLSQLLSPH